MTEPVYNDTTVATAKDYLHMHQTLFGDLVPSISGLAHALGVARNTIYKWRRDESKADFDAVCELILSRQEQLLLNGGLSGQFNSNIAKLMLAKHDYSDKRETTSKNMNIDMNSLTKEELEYVVKHGQLPPT